MWVGLVAGLWFCEIHDLALYISNEKVIWPIMSGIGFWAYEFWILVQW